MPNRNPTEKQLIVRVPHELHRQLKTLAAQSGTSMNAIALEALQKAVARAGRKAAT